MKKYCTPLSEISKWKVGDRIIAMNDSLGSDNIPQTWWKKGDIAIVRDLDLEKSSGGTIAHFISRDTSFYIIADQNKFMLNEDYLNIQKNIALVESL